MMSWLNAAGVGGSRQAETTAKLTDVSDSDVVLKMFIVCRHVVLVPLVIGFIRIWIPFALLLTYKCAQPGDAGSECNSRCIETTVFFRCWGAWTREVASYADLSNTRLRLESR